MANKKIEEVEGIGPSYAAKLGGCGVKDTDGLLEKARTKKGRQELATAAEVSEKLVLQWANMADLFRIKGVAGEYAELLKASGVDTVVELAQRRADNLATKMAEVNAEKKLTRVVPTEKVVEGWVEQAKGLDRVMEY